MGPLIFHVHATYIISRFQHKRFLSFSAANELRTDGLTDGQAQTNMPSQLLRSWGHNKNNSKRAYQLVKDLTSEKQGRSSTLVGSVQYTCPVVPLCIVDASLSHYVGN